MSYTNQGREKPNPASDLIRSLHVEIHGTCAK